MEVIMSILHIIKRLMKGCAWKSGKADKYLKCALQNCKTWLYDPSFSWLFNNVTIFSSCLVWQLRIITQLKIYYNSVFLLNTFITKSTKAKLMFCAIIYNSLLYYHITFCWRFWCFYIQFNFSPCLNLILRSIL